MYSFVDAQIMQKKYPATFEAPIKERLDELVQGDFIKLCLDGERFWAEVESIDGNKIKARVDNDLVNITKFSYNDIIEVEKRHVYDMIKGG